LKGEKKNVIVWQIALSHMSHLSDKRHTKYCESKKRDAMIKTNTII
jgi:hypothetical protein